MSYQALINLHEDLFHFLMNYREHSKFSTTPTFLFRSLDDEEALSEGRWFYDNYTSQKSSNDYWVNLYFTLPKKNVKYKSKQNIQYGIKTNKEWNIRLNDGELPPPSNEEEYTIFKTIFYQFNNIASPSTFNNNFNLFPFDKNYRSGLLKGVEVLNGLLERVSLGNWIELPNLPFEAISEESFQASLANILKYRKKRIIKNVYINNFHIKNYQGIVNAQLENLPSTNSWIFLTGENGFGKTSLLRAIATGLHKNIEPQDKNTNISLSYSYRYTQDLSIQIENNISEPLFFRSLPALATYGPSRLELQAEGSHGQEAKNSTAVYSLFHTDGILKNIQAELRLSYYKDPKKFEAIQTMLKALIPSLDKVELNTKLDKVIYYEKVKSEKEYLGYSNAEFEQLAAGIRSIIAMAGDIYLRLSETNKPFFYENKKNLNTAEEPLADYPQTYNPKDLYGVVIIDELDLHLHPKWQRELPKLLSSVFPKVQFIASTHSPIPLLGAPAESVFLKVDRTMEQGIYVTRLHKLEKEIRQLLPNTILTSPIFDFDFFEKYSEEEFEHLYLENNYEQIKENEEINERLKKLNPNDFPENLDFSSKNI